MPGRASKLFRREAQAGAWPGHHQHMDSVVLELHYRELLNFLTRKVNDRDVAADLLQESYLRVLTLQDNGGAVLDVGGRREPPAPQKGVGPKRRAPRRPPDGL